MVQGIIELDTGYGVLGKELHGIRQFLVFLKVGIILGVVAGFEGEVGSVVLGEGL